MTTTRRAIWSVAVSMGLGLIRFWWRTCKVVSVVGAQHLPTALERAPSLIPVFWHQHLLFCAKYLLDQREHGLRVGFLISPSVDGELGAMAAARLGATAIRGSSTHTGARTLRDFYEALVKDNVSTVVTPDGPRGPRFQFKSGAIVLSQMTGRPIVPMAYAARRATTFHWDKFVLPWPFTHVAIAIGEPRWIPKSLDAAAVELWQRELARELHRLYREAAAALGPAQ
ncbi:MAG: lysophospholipid acyltransferase family protein [Pseudomonadales bacterium]|nr:lysophospholipid acyltransferase family protein [Pseudomonadales bacterium]